MRPIFTIHAGEYLVATKIEESFPSLRIWIPSKDSGVDLLVTDARQDKVASLQVKFSKDYLGTVTNPSVTTVAMASGSSCRLPPPQRRSPTRAMATMSVAEVLRSLGFTAA